MSETIQQRPFREKREAKIAGQADALVIPNAHLWHGEIPSLGGGGAGDSGLVSPVPQRSGVEVCDAWKDQFADAPDVLKKAPDDHQIVKAGGVAVGDGTFVTMAGPCSVETERQLMETAQRVAAAGARILRGGAFKPRSSPYAFQGLGVEGLKLLAAAREATGLAIVTEVMAASDAPMVAEYADILQIGSRSMENYALLEAAARTGRPILLKRGMVATIADLLRSAQCLVSYGNPNVMLCERGIRTFETATRNTFDVSAIVVLKEITRLPVIADPSHAAGRRCLVPALARSAVAAGADGLIVEVHPDPERAWSDGEQSLTLGDFDTMMADLAPWCDLRAACSYALETVA